MFPALWIDSRTLTSFISSPIPFWKAYAQHLKSTHEIWTTTRISFAVKLDILCMTWRFKIYTQTFKFSRLVYFENRKSISLSFLKTRIFTFLPSPFQSIPMSNEVRPTQSISAVTRYVQTWWDKTALPVLLSSNFSKTLTIEKISKRRTGRESPGSPSWRVHSQFLVLQAHQKVSGKSVAD